MQLLHSRASIEAAIATMHPVAAEAAKYLAYEIATTPNLLEDGEALQDRWIGAIAQAATEADLTKDQLEVFLENHGQAVLNVAVSIVVFLAKSAERKRKWGWIGKAAALAGGVAIASFFG